MSLDPKSAGGDLPAPNPEWTLTSRILAAVAVVLALYLYLARLDGTPLQRGNEAMYASPPALMLENGDYLVPLYRGQHFLDKPILPFWVVAASYKLLGVSVFAERLPTALAGLATALLMGLWIRRRAGGFAGFLAAIVLLFSFLYVFVGMTFAADAFLTLALLGASILLDGATRTEGSDALWGAASGAALAIAFGFKGLIGIVLPCGAVAATLLLDRRWPVRFWRRAPWAFVVLVAILGPYHWAMDRRLGMEFWDVFYWKNQFLRGASRIYMRGHRGALYYVGVIGWGLFPWSFPLLASFVRRKPSSLPLGAFLFGLAFWSPLVMKREVYAVTLLPAAVALVAEGMGAPKPGSRTTWPRILWGLAGVLTLGAVGFWVWARPLLTEPAGRGVTLLLGVSLAVLAAAVLGCAARPRSATALLAAALACGVVGLAGRLADERFGRFDPLPAWGERARAACRSGGCDGFVYGEDVTSLEFYSGFDWAPVIDPGREIPAMMTHDKAFVVVKSRLEPLLDELPYRWEVLERCPTYGSYSMDQLIGKGKGSVTLLSLVKIER
jgi:4-amino-4-deoxy-L-arabinose transferase-like glycosyltransferase